MPFQPLPKKPHRVAALTLALAVVAMKLAACTGLNPNPPDPHKMAADDLPFPLDGGLPDAGDALDGSP